MDEKVLIALSGFDPMEIGYIDAILCERPNDFVLWFGTGDIVRTSSINGFLEVSVGCDPIMVLKFVSQHTISRVVFFDYNPFLTFEMLKLIKKYISKPIIVVKKVNGIRDDIYKDLGGNVVLTSQTFKVEFLLKNNHD